MSEYQALDEHVVTPSRMKSDTDSSPRPIPYTVTALDPVAALLLGSERLTAPVMAEKASLLLLTRSPTVATVRPLLPIAWVAEQSTQVSEDQSVCSQALWPSRADGEKTNGAMSAPCIDTATAPVEAPL